MEPGKKRALIVSGGGLRGTYAFGVLKKLGERVGLSQYESVYAVSVGVFISSFFVSDQMTTCEKIWKNWIHGDQLIKYRNLFKGKPILDLEYLTGIFKTENGLLDVEGLKKSPLNLIFVLTDYETGLAEYHNAKEGNIFELMKGSAALPCAYNKAVIINGKRYFDGGIADPLPIKKVIADGFKQIDIIITKPPFKKIPPQSKLVSLLCVKNPESRTVFRNIHLKWEESFNLIKDLENTPGFDIRLFGNQALVVKRLTRKRETLIQAIEQGERDAESILNKRN